MQEVMEVKATDINRSAEKALTIIEYLSGKNEPVRLMDMAKDLKINASTLLRFLTSLTRCGYVFQNPDTLKYSLTYKICAIANKVAAKSDIRELALPYMRELSTICKESVCLAVKQYPNIVYIEVVEGPDSIVKTMQRIGNFSPMHCTGIGKLFLSKMSDEQLLKHVEKNVLEKFTNSTITTFPSLKDECEKIRFSGYALDNEECEIGAKCIAVPVYDFSGDICAGISVTGPIFRLTDENINRLLPYIIAASEKISDKMGYEKTAK